MSKQAKLNIDEERCKGCALCTTVCPRNLVKLSDTMNKLGFLPANISDKDLESCTSCALCAQMCPDVAISVYREVKEKA
ncbi:MAG: tungsten formylmethanofuran dehydrogenase [Desulfuromonas sp.]|nr:MAG: tungsten formylmethanofuran dehydrogenase [Desulfuromonas sp.]